MDIVGERLKYLRNSIGLSQAKMAKLAGCNQPSINRYENGVTAPPLELLAWYADYFDISLDFIFGRADKPQGKLYQYEPKIIKEKFSDEARLKEFVEFCFTPGTVGNEKLKATLAKMLGGDQMGKEKGDSR